MRLRSLFAPCRSGTIRASRCDARLFVRPGVEPLEDRLTPSTLVSVANHRDLVYDATRGLLYITTSAGTVQRYNPVSNTLLSAFTIGTALNGADISASGNYLYATDSQVTAGNAVVHKVDLSTGTPTNLTYAVSGGESGSWDVAINANGKALLDGQFAGSGWVPLRQIDLATDTFSTRIDDPGSGGSGKVRQNSLITRGADGSLDVLTESNISSGPLFTYRSGADTFSAAVSTDGFLDNALTAVSRDGSLVATEVGNAVTVADANLNVVANLKNADGGLVFDPTQNLLYVASSATNQVIAYDTTTWVEKYRLDVGEAVTASSACGHGIVGIRQWRDGRQLRRPLPVPGDDLGRPRLHPAEHGPHGQRQLPLPVARGARGVHRAGDGLGRHRAARLHWHGPFQQQ